MERGTTGHYVPAIAGGNPCQAFIPAALPPTPPLQLDAKLQRRINLAMLALGRLDAISTLLPDAHLFLYSYVRKEAVMSSQIEGTQSSLSDLMLFEMDGVPGVPLDDVQEVSCYVNALYLGVERIRDGHPITFRLLSDLHTALMTSGRGINKGPGQFRRHQVWIGGHRADEATFVPTPANELANCWAELERFVNDVPEPTDPLIKAALAHVQFETIHPFMDGNGRVGRLLIPLILVASGVLTQPLLYLSVFFKKHRQTYYDRLQQVRLTGDWESWLLFFVDAVADTAQKAVSTAQQLNALREEHRERLSRLGLALSARQVLDALFEHPIVNINTLVTATGLTPATVGKVLNRLSKADIELVNELTGQKRNRVYAYSAYIAILNQDCPPHRIENQIGTTPTSPALASISRPTMNIGDKVTASSRLSVQGHPMRIKVINPNTTASMTDKIGAAAKAVAAPGTEIIAVNPDAGPVSIEGHYDEAISAVALLDEIRSGEADGIDGYVIACFGDPGLLAAREVARGPVLGIAEAAMHAASFIATGFSVVTTLGRTKIIARHLVRAYGMEHFCLNVRACELEVLALEDPHSDARRIITDECRRARDEDGAGAIVLGCGGMADLAADIGDQIGIPVIDGVTAAVKFVEALVGLGLGTSKHGDLAYPLAKPYTGAFRHLAPG